MPAVTSTHYEEERSLSFIQYLTIRNHSHILSLSGSPQNLQSQPDKHCSPQLTEESARVDKNGMMGPSSDGGKARHLRLEASSMDSKSRIFVTPIKPYR